MKRINQLVDCSYDFFVSGVSDDSREIKDGFLFVATHGFFVDHSDFISDALEKGAVGVVTDKEIELPVPVVLVDDANLAYDQICQRFYDISLDVFSFIGVTGTDGKTTSTTIIQNLLDKYNKTALIGTNGLLIDGKYDSLNNTTPCTLELYNSLHKIEKSGCKNVVMEVSSEALLHKRLNSFQYDIIGYTNITSDHLNIHSTIENYVDCKLSFLNLLKDDGIVVFNGDDENCKLISCKNMYSYGFDSNNDYVISDVKQMSNTFEFAILNCGKKYKITSPFKGKYNVYNVTLAFIVCLLKGIDSEFLIDSIKSLGPVLGRGEYLDFGQDYTIILDYAHTLNGICNILDSVKDYKNIITVTGAAGGREKEKRSSIGEAVLEKSDVVIFTMDDPRYESVDEIIDQMAGNHKDYMRIIDRSEAIKKALDMATKDSVVLILGKGRDNYMAIEDKRVEYCDYEVIKKYFENNCN